MGSYREDGHMITARQSAPQHNDLIIEDGAGNVVYEGVSGIRGLQAAIDHCDEGTIRIEDDIKLNLDDRDAYGMTPDDPEGTRWNIFHWEKPVSITMADDAWIRLYGAPAPNTSTRIFRPSGPNGLELDVNIDFRAQHLDYDRHGPWTENFALISGLMVGNNLVPTEDLLLRLKAKNFHVNEQPGTGELSGLGAMVGFQGQQMKVRDCYFERGDTAMWFTTEFGPTPAGFNVQRVHVRNCGRGDFTHSKRALYWEAGEGGYFRHIRVDNSNKPFVILDLGEGHIAGPSGNITLEDITINGGSGPGFMVNGARAPHHIELRNFEITDQQGVGMNLGRCITVDIESGRIEGCSGEAAIVQAPAHDVLMRDIDIVDNGGGILNNAGEQLEQEDIRYSHVAPGRRSLARSLLGSFTGRESH